jgi:hypothetical protein
MYVLRGMHKSSISYSRRFPCNPLLLSINTNVGFTDSFHKKCVTKRRGLLIYLYYAPKWLSHQSAYTVRVGLLYKAMVRERELNNIFDITVWFTNQTNHNQRHFKQTNTIYRRLLFKCQRCGTLCSIFIGG